MRKLFSLMLAVMLLAACGGAGTTTNTATTATTGNTMMATATTAMMETAMPMATATTAMMETSTAGSTTGGKKLRIALVTDTGKVNDGTFNQFAYDGMKRAETELGVEINYIETAQQSDYEKNLGQFADEKYDLVIGVGFLMGDALKAVATKYPNTKFAIVDVTYDPVLPNVKGMAFQEDESGFLAGVAAALVSKSGKIGFVGGVEIPPVQKFRLGYEAGAKSVNPAIEVAAVYLPSFTDAAAGSEAAKSQISDGADVIFGAGGQTGSGGIQAAAQQGVYVIGVDQDEFVTTFKNGSTPGADKIITSALKRVDNVVYSVIQELVEGKFLGGSYVGTVANGGVDFAPAHNASAAITPEILTRLNEVKANLGNGTIKTNVTLP